MALRYDTISFMSDYGHTDEFVGVVHSVIRQLAPGALVIDITHEVPPYDVRAGGLTLGRCAQYLAPGVVLAVVDPGVGSQRRPIAVEVGDGQSVLIGPDNGVLAAAVAVAGGATRAVWLNNPEYQLASAGSLFDGRDIFAPAAAHLCNGVPFEDLGELISTASLLPGTLPIPEQTDEGLVVEVLWIDHYGNVQLNADPAEVDALGDVFTVRSDSTSRTVRRVGSFSEIGTGAVGMVTDSYGALALVCNQASAAEEFRVETEDPLTLSDLGGSEQESGAGRSEQSDVTTPVRLSTAPGRIAR
ncbi:MAG: SAM-dependent chlorinase/fluorinase [Microthrixaceae bacterium]